MSDCAKPVNQISGRARGRATNIGKLVVRAIRHLITTGQNSCTGGCDSGMCKFGLTNINEDITITPDASGPNVTVTVTGDGQCFCG